MLIGSWIRAVTPITVLVPLLMFPVDGQRIRTDRKTFVISTDGTQVVLQGTWHRTTQRPTVEVPSVNSVRIECYRTAWTCNEYLAKFIQKTDDPLGTVTHPYLFLMKTQFRVIDWTATTIVARSEPGAAQLELHIRLTAKTAQRTSLETAARGGGADPKNISEWVLE